MWTADDLWVVVFGLRGLEGNPIVQVMNRPLEDITRLLEHGGYEVDSEAVTSPEETAALELPELIDMLQLAPEREWKSTYILGLSIALPIQDLDAAQPVLDDFVTLFPLFRAATNVFLGEDDRLQDYVKCFWDWQNQLQGQDSATITRFFPDEVDSAQKFREGAVRQVSVNAYERDPKARQKCIDCYGSSCSVCDFDFGRTFGQLGQGFIHVHHLRPIAEIAAKYEVDPVKDLRLVCPNCHAMIHRRLPSLSIEEIQILLKSNRIFTP